MTAISLTVEIAEDLKNLLDRYLEERSLHEQDAVINAAIAAYLQRGGASGAIASPGDLSEERVKRYREVGHLLKLERYLANFAIEDEIAESVLEGVFHQIHARKVIARVAIDRITEELEQLNLGRETLPISWQARIEDNHLDGGVFADMFTEE